MTVDPAVRRRELREGHADLEGDPRLLGQDLEGPKLPEARDEGVEQVPDTLRLPVEMRVEAVASAGVALVAVGESPVACRASPERRHSADAAAPGVQRQDAPGVQRR